MKEKFVIIDGTSLVHRAFYAIPILTNREGVFTNAVYGFTNILLRIIEQEEPKYLAVAFDKGRTTFRHETFEDYKGHRKPSPPELKPQFALIQRILEALNISFFELENYEADDIIGTFVKVGENRGLFNVVVSGDKDTLQLISENTVVLLTRKGISQTDFFNRSKLKETYGLDPSQMIDVKGLMGDASDNIPGVPSVGEKTALKLLQQYGSLEAIYENIEQVKGSKLKDALLAYKDQAFLSKGLATIECCVPMEFELDDCLYKKPNYSKLLGILRELEFNSLVGKFLAEMKPEDTGEPGVQKVDIHEFINRFDKRKPVSMTLELKSDQVTPQLERGIMVQEQLAVVVNLSQEEALINFLKKYPDIKLITHDFKDIYKYFKQAGVYLKSPQDSLIAAYLLNPTASNYGIEELVLEHLNRALPEDQDHEKVLIEKTAILADLMSCLEDKLQELEMNKLYMEMELPLIPILADMEMAGVKIDEKVLDEMGQVLQDKVISITQEIYDIAGEEFNINSPKQLGVILFEKLDLPVIKKTKTGYSTNAEVLEQIAAVHPIGEKLLEYRQITKLKGTYVDGLKTLKNIDTGKVHTTFKQTITATGRLSSVEPNLQNIPIRMEEGRRLRKAFIPSLHENTMIAADYSQIELRILAHLSQDENLLDAFAKGQDIHTRTASEVFGVPMDQVTPAMRRGAKAVNFGIVYGISDFGLSRDLGIPRKEAKQYIDQYFIRYNGVYQYIQKVVEQARENGYVSTLLNRRRYLPDLFSPNKGIRSFGERAAMNTPIQGSAADIIKLAMIKCHETMAREELPVVMLLQVHDELIFECPQNRLQEVAEVIRYCMENAFQLDVPMAVEVKAGPNWYDLKRIL